MADCREEKETAGRIPLIGEFFPEVEVKTTFGPMVLPKDFAGKWFVLFSHPADFTPICTTEFVGFATRAEKFRAEETELIGLSIDQIFSHLKWVEWIEDNMGVKVPFPIIADGAGSLSSKLGDDPSCPGHEHGPVGVRRRSNWQDKAHGLLPARGGPVDRRDTAGGQGPAVLRCPQRLHPGELAQ